jgi:hypothetical protein
LQCRAWHGLEGAPIPGFDLVDLNSGDHVADYSSVHAALQDVWDVIVLGGERAVAATRLEYDDGSGRTKVLAEGAGLVKLAVLTHLRQN